MKFILEKLELINLSVLGFIVGIIPMVVFLRQIRLNETLQNYWTDPINTDFFSFYKMFLLVLAALVLLICFLLYLSDKKLIRTYYYIPIAVFSFFALASSVLSEYPAASMLGFPDRYEGLPVLLAYMLIMVVIINVVDREKYVKMLVSVALISAAVIGLQGVLQYLGADLFQTEFGQRLILPSDSYELVGELDFRFATRRVYSTMFNPNYVGSYGAMMLSLTLGLFILIKERRKKLMLGGLAVLLFAYMLGSESRAGVVGLVAGLLVLGLFLHRYIKPNLKELGVLALIFVVIFFAMDAISVNDIIGEIISPEEEVGLAEEDTGEAAGLVDIRSEFRSVIIETEEAELQAVMENGSFYFVDEDDERLTYSMDQETGEIQLVEAPYENHVFQLDAENNLLAWEYEGHQARFYLDEEGFHILGMNNQVYPIEEVPAWGFEGREDLGSSRGYIWSRSFPLLQDTMLLGFGADTYAMYFPQRDAVGKLKHLGSTHRIVDKPHNMYLQFAINTGMPSLLALLALGVMYFAHSYKLLWRSDFDSFNKKAGAALLAAAAAYAATGLFNDSVVSVAPVFWTLVGLGLSINLQLSRGSEE